MGGGPSNPWFCSIKGYTGNLWGAKDKSCEVLGALKVQRRWKCLPTVWLLIKEFTESNRKAPNGWWVLDWAFKLHVMEWITAATNFNSKVNSFPISIQVYWFQQFMLLLIIVAGMAYWTSDGHMIRLWTSLLKSKGGPRQCCQPQWVAFIPQVASLR